MKRATLFGLVVAQLVLAPPLVSRADQNGFVYLHPDSSDRYRPALDHRGAVSVIADINSITAPAMSPDATTIAFSGALEDESLGRYAIFLVNTSGSRLRQLTGGDFAEFDPAWSPDGESLAIVQNQTGSLTAASCCRLALVDADTGSVTALTSGVGAARPEFSSSGSYLVYDTPAGVWRISAGGETPTLIAAGGFDATASPNEQSVAFARRDGAWSEIWRVPVGGGSQTLLYETVGQIENLVWQGQRIHFLEHSGLGYDGRTSVTARSVHQEGSRFRIERSFNTHVVGASPAGSNDEIFFYRDDGLFRFYDIRSDGTLPSPMSAGNGYTTGWSSINAIDLDGDGLDEMFFYREDGLFRYYNIRPNGSLPLPMSSGDGYTTGWDAITALDLDGDGQDENFFYRADGLFRYYHIRPDGTLPLPLKAGDSYSGGWDVIVGLDIEGDGQDEMLFYRSDGLYRIYNVNSRATLGPPIQAGSDLGANWSSISAVDLDGDGHDEIFFYRDNGDFVYREINPNGSFGQIILSGSGYTTGWSTITSIDLRPG